MRWPARSKARSGTSRISGSTSGASGCGSRMPQWPRSSGAPNCPCAHDQRLAAAGDGRKREPRAAPAQLLHQRQRIDLALERHEAGDDRARREGDRKFSRRNRLRRRVAGVAGSASRRAIISRRKLTLPAAIEFKSGTPMLCTSPNPPASLGKVGGRVKGIASIHRHHDRHRRSDCRADLPRQRCDWRRGEEVFS